jgi:CPA1 family monovalent cation:H+ antiporter
MEHHGFVDGVVFAGFFLALTSLLHTISKKYQFPYTVALLIVGLVAQFGVYYLHIGLDLNLSPEVIFFVLLPLLLFESALHINFHQFRLQFKTLTFLATFGLLLSVFAVGFGLSLLVGMPFGVALLFGSLISATDPIAVLALFKNIGAPKRLALLIEGESMLNDATAVIVFRLIAGFVIGHELFGTSKVVLGVGDFVYVFLGSIVCGAVLGHITALAIERIKDDRIVETTLTAALAIGSFIIAEHFFQLSGVISTVIAGIYLGNFGKTKISGGVIKFIEEFWEYGGFFSVSLIFFFTAFNLNIGSVLSQPVARSIGVYTTFKLSNTLSYFKNEPNVPTNWQHVINWGGLRGIIPLVLVYSLPDEFSYKAEFLSLSLGMFMFTLFVNAMTIKPLLVKLKMHLPEKEEEIIKEEMAIFALEQAEKKLHSLPKTEFDQQLILEIDQLLRKQEAKHKRLLLRLATPEELLLSLRLQALNIENKVVDTLFDHDHINENVVLEFEIELDLQRDALEFPEVSQGRAVSAGGKIDTSGSFRRNLLRIRYLSEKLPWLRPLLGHNQESLIEERFMLLKARIIASDAVLDYLKRVGKSMLDKPEAVTAIDQVKAEHEKLKRRNQRKLRALAEDYPKLIKKYKKKLIHSLIYEGVESEEE